MPHLFAAGHRFAWLEWTTPQAESADVLLVHSSGLSAQQWRVVGPRLARRRTVRALHLTGYDASSALSRGEHALEVDAAGTLALATADEGPVHGVGHSYGGSVLLAAALRQPSAFASLCLIEPPSFGLLRVLGDEHGIGLLGFEPAVFFDPLLGGTEPWLQGFVDFWSGPGAWARMPQTARRDLIDAGPKVFREVCAVWEAQPRPDALARLKTRVTLMGGAESLRAAHRVLQRLAGLLPDATLRLLDGLGHMFPVTHPKLTVAELEAHFRAQGQTTS